MVLNHVCGVVRVTEMQIYLMKKILLRQRLLEAEKSICTSVTKVCQGVTLNTMNKR
ncbi:hypothetical protein JCM19301_791 [Jejuia pallidilutea]|uniref:Uncharacterized protein n=1 Tax=Jejuia pallidilutea TaxID=504487 RepID=A0A090W2M9_9FLAO|nr:hypothetical protein JCM19301_791 [Jejuia pallidilutea]GAL71191.1 hypothetical protein JCM19302_620 [Jejuia pallidilutea]GAL88250.1 hypothetical protein JCM19538_2613 [Jejuia pallidilutea]